MQNRTFLVLLRPIFCEKLKIASPKGKQPPLKRLNFRIWPKNQSQFRWRPFFFFFFFWDHLILGGKNLRIPELSEKFRLNFRTNRVKPIQEQWKFGSRSFAHFSLFQNSPPPPFSKSCYGNTNKYKWKRWFNVKHFVLLYNQSTSIDMLNLKHNTSNCY